MRLPAFVDLLEIQLCEKKKFDKNLILVLNHAVLTNLSMRSARNGLIFALTCDSNNPVRLT